MPNKTIIDGIDVQDCHEWYSLPDSKLYCKISNEGDFTCKSNPNCYFKQLARAKGEIEKWKHQAELGSDTADRLSKELEDKNQEIEKLKAQIENEKQALQIDIDNLNQACLDLSQENEDLLNKLQAKEQEVKRLKKENQYHINTYCHFKNEIKKHKKAVHKYKVALQDKIKRLYLSRREFLREINSVPVRIACRGEGFKNALNNFNNAIQVINDEDKYKHTLDEIEKKCSKYQTCIVVLKKDILDIINKAKDSK